MKSIHPSLLREDLDFILGCRPEIWKELSGARIFITGGTGFIGTWLVESLLWARRYAAIDVEVTVLSRDPSTFFCKVPHLNNDPALRFVVGDVRNFKFPNASYTHVVHAATAASAKLNLEKPTEMVDTIVNGSIRVFEFAERCGAKTVLQTSSGGVYGPQPSDMSHISEDFKGSPDPLDPYAAYSESKRLSEMIGSVGSRKFGFEHKVARITALVGPHLPLDIHYALGNFIRDAMLGQTIEIKGDGSPIRSYLYVADLMVWLLVIMLKGQNNRPYNVGSEIGISLSDLARLVVGVRGVKLAVSVANCPPQDGRPNRYVPSTRRAREELGLCQWTDLESSIRKTFDWHQAMQTR